MGRRKDSQPMTAATLTLFEVSGNYRAVVAPFTSGSTNVPVITVITGTVDFIPRLPAGFLAYVDNYDLGSGLTRDTAIALPMITARITEGQLCSIDIEDAPGVELVANTDVLAGIDELIYDVRFRNVVYGRSDQQLLPFAFTAPTTSTALCITDPALERLTYQSPIRRYA
ncbi:MAG: hypothetical protein WCO97_07670 [bacterium]